MCTVSVIPLPGGGCRLVSSRDEERSRAHALPPRRPAQHPAAVWPVDPVGGGTWIAAADYGLALTLLNGNPTPPFDRSGLELTSRGVLIPELIDRRSAAEAVAALGDRDLSPFAPFRLVAVDASGAVIDARWDRRELLATVHDRQLACFASSGLGDRLVACRVPLFDELVVPHPTPAAQDLFHAHRWPDRPELSVLMSRPAARTVSVTAVELTPGKAPAVSYRPVQESRPGPGRQPATRPSPARVTTD